MADSVSYCDCFQCFVLSLLSVSYALIVVMGFILSWLSVFYTVSAFSISRYHGCQGFILLWLSVFHTVVSTSVSYCHRCQFFYTVMAVSVFILSVLSGCQYFYTVSAFSVSRYHGC